LRFEKFSFGSIRIDGETTCPRLALLLEETGVG